MTLNLAAIYVQTLYHRIIVDVFEIHFEPVKLNSWHLDLGIEPFVVHYIHKFPNTLASIIANIFNSENDHIIPLLTRAILINN